MIKTEWNEASYAQVGIATPRELSMGGGYDVDLDTVEDDELDAPALVIEGDGGLAYIITGDLDTFARKVLEAIHGE